MSRTEKKRKNNVKVQDLVYMAMGTVIITVCSWISIPAAVPFTLQTFAVFLVISLLGGKRGTVSIIVYILLGAAGAPVFSGMSGGFVKLIGVTGGYIIGFIFIGLIFWLFQKLSENRFSGTGISTETQSGENEPDKNPAGNSLMGQECRGSRRNRKKLLIRAAALLTGLLVCYAFGTVWFIAVYTGSSEPVGLGKALGMCVIPFILPDLAKMAASLILAERLRKVLHII